MGFVGLPVCQWLPSGLRLLHLLVIVTVNSKSVGFMRGPGNFLEGVQHSQRLFFLFFYEGREDPNTVKPV